MPGSTIRHIDVRARDGFPLAAQFGGRPGAPALLLLPGQANSHRWWDGLRAAFEDDFTTVTFDYRGTGGSRRPYVGAAEHREERGTWSTASFADDAADVLRAAGIASAAVYGASMGGRVAQMLAIRHPALVDAIVLACTSPGGARAVAPDEQARRDFSGAGAAGPEDRLRTLHAMFYTPRWPHPPSASPLLGDGSMSPGERGAHRRASQGHNAWEALPSVSAPTLVLHGAHDRITPPQNAALLAERIPGSRSVIHPDGRHGFFHEFAETVNQDVLDFLSH